VIDVSVRAVRTARCIASVRIWALISTTSASIAATLWYSATEIRWLPSLTKLHLADLV
jgi:hypothetical protein